MPTPIENNTTALQEILNTANNLPSAGAQLPALSNPAGAENIQNGYEAIDGAGAKVTGTLTVPNVIHGTFTISSTVSGPSGSVTIPELAGLSNFIAFNNGIAMSSSSRDELRYWLFTLKNGGNFHAYYCRPSSDVAAKTNNGEGINFNKSTGKITLDATSSHKIYKGTYEYVGW